VTASRASDSAARQLIDDSTLHDLIGLSPSYRVEVTPDGLTALLEVTPPAGQDDPPADLGSSLDYLTRVGVLYGVDAEDVGRAARTPGTQVVVAQGRPARDGEDGRLDVEPELLEIGGRPRVEDDGRVDLFDLNLIHTVREGQVLARRVLPTPGEPGMNVRGRGLPARAGKPAPGTAGQGTRLTEDGLEIVAAVDGHVVVVGDHLSVSSIYNVRSDVGVATGHVAYVGSVVVRGNVLAGFRLKADGDVEIHGNVNGGVIEAGGNLSVRYGILGQAQVVAAGTVRAKFIEYADVKAGGAVWISDGIVQSKISAARIEVLGRHGSVVGGHVFARMSLTARDLGSAGGVRTTVAVGVAPELVPESQRLSSHQDEMARKVPKLQARIKYFEQQAQIGRLNRIGAQEMESAQVQLKQLFEELEVAAARQLELTQEIAELSGAFIDARDVCHPEVLVVIGTDNLPIRQALRAVRFSHSALSPKIEVTSLDI
jgi:uncharacterized protein (DUF342 family)